MKNINRIIIDEADSINIPNMPFINSRFIWFITRTPELDLSMQEIQDL